jgi:hypothetical protein
MHDRCRRPHRCSYVASRPCAHWLIPRDTHAGALRQEPSPRRAVEAHSGSGSGALGFHLQQLVRGGLGLPAGDRRVRVDSNSSSRLPRMSGRPRSPMSQGAIAAAASSVPGELVDDCGALLGPPARGPAVTSCRSGEVRLTPDDRAEAQRSRRTRSGGSGRWTRRRRRRGTRHLGLFLFRTAGRSWLVPPDQRDD